MTSQSQPTSRTALPLQRRHMPTGYAISLADYTKRGTPEEVRIPKDFGPEQSLRGFEATYRNIIDYIVRITYRIWEDREVEYIRATYAEGARTYDDYGLQLGDEKIVQDTHHTTAAFSDIRLIADEIVWPETTKWASTPPTEPSFAAPTTGTASTARPPANPWMCWSSPTASPWRTRSSWSMCSTTTRPCCSSWAWIWMQLN